MENGWEHKAGCLMNISLTPEAGVKGKMENGWEPIAGCLMDTSLAPEAGVKGKMEVVNICPSERSKAGRW